MTTDRQTGEQLWQRLLEAISPRVSNHVFETWIRPVRCVGHEAGVIRLEVRDLFARDWLRDHYLDVLREQLATLAGEPLAIEWEVARERAPEPDAPHDEPSSVTVSGSRSGSFESSRIGSSAVRMPPLASLGRATI